jgi:hypothetical protein
MGRSLTVGEIEGTVGEQGVAMGSQGGGKVTLNTVAGGEAEAG